MCNVHRKFADGKYFPELAKSDNLATSAEHIFYSCFLNHIMLLHSCLL